MSADKSVLPPKRFTADKPDLPELPFDSWKDTMATLHMWTQIVGKVRLKLTPLVNHWWNVPLYLNARGLTTSAMPYGSRSIEIRFDFIDHQLVIDSNDGRWERIDLKPQTVAEFYKKSMSALEKLGVNVTIWTTPCELPDPIAFEEDEIHASYDRDAVHKFWIILTWVAQVFEEFRAKYIGKVSPVHFFWGSFDLAVTRFSGRPAPERPGADPVTREAYSHEVSSAGFWPGGGSIKGPAFYSYAAPAGQGFAERKIRPEAAGYSGELNEFLLMYDDLRNAESPKHTLMEFLQSTYDAAADSGKWDRKALERASK